MVTEITMAEMQKADTDDGSVRIVMFYGPTCGPCKATMPHYEAAAHFFETKGAKMQCFKINAWEPQEQFAYCKDTWGVEGVPHFKVFFRGTVIKDKVGGGDEEGMKAFLVEIVDDVFNKFQEKI